MEQQNSWQPGPGNPRGAHGPGLGGRGGGTSVDETNGSRGLWIGLIVAFVAIIATVVVFLGGEDSAASAMDAGADVSADSPQRSEPLPAGPSRELLEAVAKLGAHFDAEKVISNVNLAPAQPSVLLIKSVYCSDKSLSAVLAEHMTELRERGVKLVRCAAPDGTVVLEKQL